MQESSSYGPTGSTPYLSIGLVFVPLSIIIIILCSLDKMILIVAPPIISESGTIINAGSDPYIGLHITSINAMMNMKIR